MENASDPAANSKRPSLRKTIRPLARLFGYLRHYRLLVAAALFFLLVAAATTLTLPMAVRRMIDYGFSAENADLINSYFAMLFMVAALLAVASALRYYFVILIGERVVADLRRDVFNHVMALSPSFYDVNQSGEIVSRLTADTTQIKSAVGATASLALRNTILCIGAVIMMIVTSPKLAAIVLGAIPIIVFPLVGFGRAVRRRSRQAQDQLASASAYAGEAVGAVRTVQAFTAEDVARQSFAGAVENAFDAARAAIRSRSILTGFAITLVFGSMVGVLWIGAQNVLTGNMSAGTLSQFLLYSVFAAGSLGALSEVWGELSQASGAAERLMELMAEEPGIEAPLEPVALPQPGLGALRFDHVGFAYPSRPEIAAIHGLSFSIRPGETVAVVGPSGAGKSTLFSLILRFYDPDRGRILLDGVDIRSVDPRDLRHRIAVVPQDTTVFATTVRDNIAFGSEQAEQSDIVAAAKAAYAHDFIERLEDGYATQLGERGVMLSGGQRQRIAIARAILKDAPVLLLDEATSALDAESETLVQAALERLMEGRTTIVVAHRLATILKADRILVMDEGRIVEEGTHRSLIAHGGLYARLANLQFTQDALPEDEMATADGQSCDPVPLPATAK